jgi:hypothetical protein
MPRGGIRPGAGRPPAGRKASVLLRLSPDVAQQLRWTIPPKTRSAWVENLIVAGLSGDKHPGNKEHQRD